MLLLRILVFILLAFFSHSAWAQPITAAGSQPALGFASGYKQWMADNNVRSQLWNPTLSLRQVVHIESSRGVTWLR